MFEEEHNRIIADLKFKFELAGGEQTGLSAARATLKPSPERPTTLADKQTMTESTTR
jgi:hypothetical protein